MSIGLFLTARRCQQDLTYGLTDEQHALLERRQKLVHTLGNLTLLTKPANIEILNYAFEPEKKARLRASLLRINQDVAAEPQWSEDAIVRRAQRLAELAITIWPAPVAVSIPAVQQGAPILAP